MKTAKSNTLIKNLMLIVLAITIMIPLSSCVKKVDFLSSSVVPASSGYVKMKKDNNKNYQITIHLKGLAEASKLDPPMLNYVVWMITDQEITNNIGQLNSSSGLFSKDLEASFETVSSFKPIKIFITAENNAAIQYPKGQVVLSTEKF